MAQLIVAAASATIGAFIGGPVGFQVGWTVGRMAYSMANPARSYGPRLSDLKVTGTEYGQPIPYAIGHPRLAGQLIYASEKYEIADTQTAGKGGGQEYTSYTYEVDLLYLLTDNEMADVTRIWLNGELIWTNLVDPDNPDVSLSSIIASINSEKWQRMTVYTGSADQLPDPDYEAAVTNAPAYRGRTTVFIKRLKLGGSGQIPQLTFEVTRTAPPIDTGVSDMGVLPGNYSQICYNPLAVDSLGARSFVADWTTSYPSSSTAKLYRISLDGTVTVEKTINISPTSQCAFLGFADSPILLFKKQNSYSSISSTIYWWTESGVRGEITLPESVGFSQLVYAFQSGVIYIGSNIDGYSNTIYRVENSGYSSSLPLPEPVQSIVECAGYLYCAGYDTSSKIYKLNADTLEYIGYITKPGSSSNYDKSKLASGGGQLYSFDGSNGYTLVGSTWETVWTAIGHASSIAAVLHQITGMYGANYWSSANLDPNHHIYSIGSLGGVRDDPLQTVVEMLCDRAGMPAGSYDASALASITKPVRALAISQVGATRATLEMLMQSHYVGAYVTDKLYFVPRGGAAVATVPYSDLGATTGDTVEALPLKWGNELELPATIAVSYANVDADYNTATEESDRLLTSQGSSSTLQLAMGMTSAEAKGVANTAVADSVAALLTSTLYLPPSYSALVPTDVVNVLDSDGSSYRMRIVKRNDTAGVLAFEVVRDDAQALQDVGISSTDYTASTVVDAPADTVLVALDAPILRDADDAPGYYLAAKGASTPWPGCAAYGSANGADYTLLAQILASSVIGVTTSTLGDWAGIGMDTANSVTVNVGSGQLASATRDALLGSDSVNALWFSTGEILRFQNATLVSAGVYTLTGLLRGQRGTEQFTAAHATGETVVLLTSAGLRRVTTQTAEIGQARTLKGVTLNRALSTATGAAFTNTGRAQKPFAPVDARAVRAANGNITLSWKPRTRYATSFCGPAGINVPMSDPDNYRVEIRTAGGVTLRTITVTGARSTTYAIADQITDWGSPPTTLYLRISQVSTTVGAGYALSATIPCALISAGAGAEVGMRPLLEAGGITTAGGLLTTLRSTDGGHTYTSAAATVPSHLGTLAEPGVSVLGSQYIAPAYNISTGYAGMIVGNTDPATTPTRYDPSTPLDITTGYPRTGAGATILPGAVWSDGTYHYAVGRQANNTTDDAKLYLYRADSSLAFSLVGEMTANGSDPNAIAANTYGGWHAVWFVPYRVAAGSQATSRLFKFGGRWFLVGAYAIYYSDDTAGLTGWTRCPTGLGEGATNPPVTILGMVACGSYLVAVRANNLGTCIAVSSDNGSTWSASRPAALVDFDAPLGVATDGTTVFVYFSRGTTTLLQYVLTASGTFTSWSASSCGLGAGQLLDGQASILATSTGIASTVNTALVWSDDGITFTSPSIT